MVDFMMMLSLSFFLLNATSFEIRARLLRELYSSRVGLLVFVRAGMGGADSGVNAYFQLWKCQ
jgi:hypothetical protein